MMMQRRIVFILIAVLTSLVASAGDMRLRMLQALSVPRNGLVGNHYFLHRTDPLTGNKRVIEYWLDFPQHRLMRREQQGESLIVTWANPERGWSEQDGTRVCLNVEEREKALTSLRYHFFYLFAQPAVQLTELSERRWRVNAPFLDAFTVQLSHASQITDLDFGSGSTGKELDYRQVDGVWWPFRFEAYRGGMLTSSGEFMNFRIRSVNAELEAADAERACVAPSHATNQPTQ